MHSCHAVFSQFPQGDHLFQQCLQSPDPVADILQALSRDHESHQSKRTERCLRQFQRLTQWLQDFSGVIDVLVATHAGIGCPIWVPVKFVLLTSKYYDKITEEVISMIEKISGLLPRLKIYEGLSPEPELQVALLDLFTDMIKFCVLTLKYTSRKLPVRVAKVISTSTSKELSDIRRRLANHAENVDKIAVAIELAKAQHFREQHRKEINKNQLERTRQWLRPIDNGSRLRRLAASKVVGTTEWIWSRDELKAWQTASGTLSSDRILCIVGKAGCGKTFVAGSILEKMASDPDRGTLSFSFFAGETALRTTNTLVRSLLWQALLTLDDGQRNNIVNNLIDDEKTLEDDLWSALTRAISLSKQQVVCVIDGIDECRDPVSDLFKRVLDFQVACPQISSLLFGQRHILEAVESPMNSLTITPDLVKADIDLFVRTHIQKSQLLNDDEIRQTVFTRITEGADGMFLWAQLMLDDLERSNSKHELIQRLHTLPYGLEATYNVLLERLLAELDEGELGLASAVLRLLTVACRRLTLDEISVAYALSLVSNLATGTPPSFTDCLLVDPVRSVTKVCRALVNIEDSRVALVHLSFKEYLTRPLNKWIEKDGMHLTRFRTDTIASHSWLASLCLDYLGLMDFNVDLADPSWEFANSGKHLDYSVKHFVYHSSTSGVIDPIILSRLPLFLQSSAGTKWLELLSCSSLSASASGSEFQDFVQLIPHFETRAQSPGVRDDFAHLLKQERTRRVRKFGATHPQTLQFDDIYHLLFTVVPALNATIPEEGNGGISGTAIEETPVRGHSQVDIAGLAAAANWERPFLNPQQLIDALQQDLRMSPLWHVRCLTALAQPRMLLSRVGDPLDLLLKLLLRHASKVSAWLLLAVVVFYHWLGKYKEAIEIEEVGVGKLEDRPLWLRYWLMHHLALSHWELGHRDLAISISTGAATGMNDLVGEHHESARLMGEFLAFQLCDAERYHEALIWILRVVKSRQRIHGNNHEKTLRSI